MITGGAIGHDFGARGTRPFREVPGPLCLVGGAGVLYVIIRSMFRFVLRIGFRWRVEGADNVPPSGAVIVCANHFHWWDPIVVACSLNRPIHFMSKSELYRNPLFAAALRAVNSFPVERKTADRKAIRRSLAILRSGHALGIFPEGTRNKTGLLRAGESGAGMLALRSGAPILPVGVSGRYRLFNTVFVRIGRPFHVSRDSSRSRSGDTGQAVASVMDAIAALLDPRAATISDDRGGRQGVR